MKAPGAPGCPDGPFMPGGPACPAGPKTTLSPVFAGCVPDNAKRTETAMVLPMTKSPNKSIPMVKSDTSVCLIVNPAFFGGILFPSFSASEMASNGFLARFVGAICVCWLKERYIVVLL